MKIIKLTIITLIAASCSREADIKKVSDNFVEKKNISKLEPSEVVTDSKVRAMTLLSYPLKNDISEWTFSPSEETSESWDLFKSSLKFGDKLPTNFDKSQDQTYKIMNIVSLVQSAGESRDNAWKKIAPLKKELVRLDQDIETTKKDKTPADLTEVVCYFAKRPVGNKPFECLSKSSETHNKTKTTDNCKEFVKFNFLDIDQNPKAFEYSGQCKDLLSELDAIKEKATIVDNEIATEYKTRSAGESIVIDLLQSIEKENNGLVLIATGATLEKNKDSSDAVSEVVISGNEIQKFSLIIDFGPNLTSGSGKVEYSPELGNIKNLKFFKDSDGVWTLSFDLLTSDFVIKTNLAYSNHPTLGTRFVGDANFHYPNGIVRKGVMKLEFDQL